MSIKPKQIRCRTCKMTWPTNLFCKDKRRKFGLQSECKICKRNSTNIRRYGISNDEYSKLLKAQNYKCWICKCTSDDARNSKKATFAIDHNHETGAVRGLLCSSCNMGIGKLMDSVELMKMAIRYIEEKGE